MDLLHVGIQGLTASSQARGGDIETEDEVFTLHGRSPCLQPGAAPINPGASTSNENAPSVVASRSPESRWFGTKGQQSNPSPSPGAGINPDRSGLRRYALRKDGAGPFSGEPIRRLPGVAIGAGLFALIVITSLSGCAGRPPATQSSQVTLTVSAASDLTVAFPEMGALFTKETGTRVVFNFGSTGQLAQQIGQGAPVDVLAAANMAFIEDLERGGFIIPGTQTLYARGRITLWPRDDCQICPQSIQDLARPEVKLIAIANPEHAPYGKAAQEALRSAGIWETVKPKLVIGENVNQTLQYAKTRNVDVAIVALSLAMGGGNPRPVPIGDPARGRVSDWVLIPESLHQPIDQALGIVKGTPREKESRRFVAVVNSPQGREIMRKYGFVLPGEQLSQ
ncbi:MAG: molybdate ABC transporter substrate-binding protein [Chloroflexi bacterium]|nr:molybdate ABC transporter substrate-binding protein [Chloroflexota bacterium]